MKKNQMSKISWDCPFNIFHKVFKRWKFVKRFSYLFQILPSYPLYIQQDSGYFLEHCPNSIQCAYTVIIGVAFSLLWHGAASSWSGITALVFALVKTNIFSRAVLEHYTYMYRGISRLVLCRSLDYTYCTCVLLTQLLSVYWIESSHTRTS
jgi:hypothetical protein